MSAARDLAREFDLDWVALGAAMLLNDVGKIVQRRVFTGDRGPSAP